MNVEIYTIDRQKIVTTIEDYDPMAIYQALNDESTGRMIVIGQVILARTDVARVVPVSS